MSNTHVMMPLASPLPWLDPLLVAELLAEKITGIPVDETDAQESETGLHLPARSHPLPRLPAYVGAASRRLPACIGARWRRRMARAKEPRSCALPDSVARRMEHRGRVGGAAQGLG